MIANAIETNRGIVTGSGNNNTIDMLYLHTKTTSGARENGLIVGTANNNGNGRINRFQDANTNYTFNDALGGDYKDNYVRMGSTLAVKTDGSLIENLSNFQSIAGTLTSTSNLMNLANLTSPAVSCSVLASTAPAFIGQYGAPFKATTGNANLVTGGMSINFATLAYGYSLANIQAGGDTFAINGVGSLLLCASTPVSVATVTVTTSALQNLATCGISCTDSLANGNVVQGSLYVPNAERAGLQYGFASNSGEVFGSVVLGR